MEVTHRTSIARARLPGTIIRLVGVAIFLSCVARATEPDTNTFTLNGLEIQIDEQNGSIRYLSYPSTGVMLEASPEAAGLLDVAYPVEAFTPMRLATRFSHAQVTREANGIRINWAVLSPSRAEFSLPTGKVSAQVTIRAADDGRSVILSCQIENQSGAEIPQILFPDLWGLRPFAGMDQTELRLARGVVHPFSVPFQQPDAVPPYYDRVGWKEYSGRKGYYAENALRWMDFGSWEGGLSVFQQRWGSPDRPDILTYHFEEDPTNLRLAWEHRTTISPGQAWQSGEFWLTPHPGGWAKGIEVFRKYVRQVNPPRQLPQHVRDGLGFQTIQMMQAPEKDPNHVHFRFADLPRVSEDARRYGLDEIVPWGWCHYFVLPVPVREELGTAQDLLNGIRQARQEGVNIAPFFSVHIILNRYLQRYGVQPGHDDWTYHPELIPRFRPYYTHELEGTLVGDDNPVWQQDVLAGLEEWINRGMTSLSWDQFIYKPAEKPALIRLTERLRALARSKDPESTFGAESMNLELDSPVLDYTWNWVDYVEAGPILNVLRSPRLNCNIDDSPLAAKKAFVEGLYLNVMPSRPDQPNSIALVSEKPALASALKQVSSLRKQFLPFFVEGTALGDSILSQPVSAFVRAYQMERKLLVFVLNDRPQAQTVVVQSDLDLWLPSTARYEVKYYDSDGKLLNTRQGHGSRWFGATRPLAPLDFAEFEIRSRLN